MVEYCGRTCRARASPRHMARFTWPSRASQPDRRRHRAVGREHGYVELLDVLTVEGVAGVEGAVLVSDLEPPDPGFGGPVGPLLRADLAGRLPLDRVVADRLRSGDRVLDVLVGEVLDQHVALAVLGARGAPRPHAGVAVGLELEPDGVAVGALLGLHLAHRAEEVLDVVAELVADDVGLDERTGRAVELLLEDVGEERRVEVDRLVAGAVERPHRRRGLTAAARGRAGERHDRGLGLELR